MEKDLESSPSPPKCSKRLLKNIALDDDVSMIFFSVFQNFDFWVVSGVKGQRMVQNDKKFCLSHFISQGPCIIKG